MRVPFISLRQLLPALLIAGLALASCSDHKDCDPKPRKCDKKSTVLKGNS